MSQSQGSSSQVSPTRRRYQALLVAAAVAVAAAYLAYQARAVFTPLLAALAIAYIFNPLVSFIERPRIPRLAIIVALYAILAGVITLLILLLVLPAIDQVLDLPDWIKGLAENQNVKPLLAYVKEHYPAQVHELVTTAQETLAAYAGQTIQHAAAAIGAIAGSMLTFVNLLILVPLYTFFFLWRFDRVVNFLGELIPEPGRNRVVVVAKQIDRTLASFFRGRLVVCTIVGIATAIGYMFADVPFALALGLLIGVLNLVPLLAAIVGLPITIVLCVVAHADVIHPLYALIAFTLVQILDNFVLSPLQGKAVGLHPITTVVVLLIGSEMAGLFGLLLAIPAAAIIKILFREFVLPELTALGATSIVARHQAQTLIFKTVGELELRADVYGISSAEPKPVIIWFHGGALIGGARGVCDDQLETFLEAGFTLVSPDYRLAPETKLPGIIEDVRDVCQWVRDKGPELLNIDPDRIVVGGDSAGGYLALMTGFCVEPRPKALVSFFGYGDVAGPWYSQVDPFYSQEPAVSKAEAYSKIGDHEISGEPPGVKRSTYYLYLRQHGLWPLEVVGHDPAAEPEAFDQYCPIRNVTPEYPPTIMIHGDKDTDVPHEQSAMMAEELARVGVEHEFITIKDGPHGFSWKDPQPAEACRQMLTFLKKHLS